MNHIFDTEDEGPDSTQLKFLYVGAGVEPPPQSVSLLPQRANSPFMLSFEA